MRALRRECKGIAPPQAILSSLGAKAPWDGNTALGGAISFALPPEGMQLPIANLPIHGKYIPLTKNNENIALQ